MILATRNQKLATNDSCMKLIPDSYFLVSENGVTL